MQRIPGVSRYRALPGGVRALGNGSKVGRETLAVAGRVASQAEALGHDNYRASKRAVTVGWKNETRAGAVVTSAGTSWYDVNNRVLVSALNGLGMVKYGPVDNKAARRRQAAKAAGKGKK